MTCYLDGYLDLIVDSSQQPVILLVHWFLRLEPCSSQQPGVCYLVGSWFVRMEPSACLACNQQSSWSCAENLQRIRPVIWMVLCSQDAADNSLLSGWFLSSSGWPQQPPAFTWMVPRFLRLEPAASSFYLDGYSVLKVGASSLQLLPGWFLGSQGCSQQPPVFYLDGSLVLKVEASGHQPFTCMVPWFLRLKPAASSLLPGWFLGS
jgi:hypothetical protein